MAPEVLEGKKYTNIVDLWSVGVSFYALLFGKHPFVGKDYSSLLADIKKNNGVHLRMDKSIKKTLSKDCKDLLRKMLTYDLTQRLSWKQFFHHPLFNVNNEPQLIKKNSILDCELGKSSMIISSMWKKVMEDLNSMNEPSMFIIKEGTITINLTNSEEGSSSINVKSMFEEDQDSMIISDMFKKNIQKQTNVESQEREAELQKIRLAQQEEERQAELQKM